MNPLLVLDDLIDFAAVQPEHVTPAVDRLLADAEAALERAVGDTVPPEHDAMSAVLDVALERLRRAWGAVGHLHGVADTPALRAAYTDNLPRITEFMTRLGADTRLYAKTKAVAATDVRMTTAQRKSVADALRDFVLGGAELQGAERERFAAVQDRLADLSQRFGEHELDATDGWSMVVDTAALEGVPADVLAATRAAAAAEGHASGHKLTLHAPAYLPVMQYAQNRGLRETVYRAYATRASEHGPEALDNGPLMREIVELRQEVARLLGHPSYAHLSLVPKMARSPEQVLGFVRDLACRAREHAERDRDELRDFATRELGLNSLEAWDRAFASERLKQQRFAFSSDEVRRYFAEPRVLEGLFDLVQTLFDVSIREAEAPAWHESVRFFHIERHGAPIAAFYIDLHARSGKQGGAWMDEARQRWRRPDGRGLQLPVAHLICNFAPPVGGQPALLTHDNLITLFHEFGHGLHHMLTQVDELALAGIAGVEWDAAELPSQFMENYCWSWDVLSRVSAHVETGAPLPRALFEKMLAARNFQSGLTMLRHCEYALFDMRLHVEADGATRLQDIAREVEDEIAVWKAPDFLRYPNTFSHLFDGGYAAGYYGYAWAEVLSADAFSAFEESGLFDVATGRRYREAILEVGGSRPAMESFVAFRGREPRLDALLRHQGIA